MTRTGLIALYLATFLVGAPVVIVAYGYALSRFGG
jgi:hypothetical protein